MKKGYKARPHDLSEVMKLGPEIVEIHASAEDLDKSLSGQYDVPVVVHFPEYADGELLDPASGDESQRLKAQHFYQRALDKTREWGEHFRGQPPKAVMHPGGISLDRPLNRLEKSACYDALGSTVRALNCKGVDLLIENMPPRAWFWNGEYYCNIFLDPRECRDYASGNGWGFCLDVCHAFLWTKSVDNRVSIMQFLKTVKPVTAHVHISDAKGIDGEGLQIGDGEMDFSEIMPFLSKIQIGVIPEIWFGHKDNFKGFKYAWNELMKMIPSEELV